MHRYLALASALALLTPAAALAQSGTAVSGGGAAVLTVVNVMPQPTACHVGLRLTNNLPYPVDMLVLDVVAHTDNDVVFDEMAVAFQGIKPTLNQYQKVRVVGLTCDKISRLRISGGDRCRMGPLARMSFDKGECLKQVVVEPSELIRIGK